MEDFHVSLWRVLFLSPTAPQCRGEGAHFIASPCPAGFMFLAGTFGLSAGTADRSVVNFAFTGSRTGGSASASMTASWRTGGDFRCGRTPSRKLTRSGDGC
jgi:hypothetical protein